MQDYRKLTMWQKSHEFALEIYHVTGSFPEQEKYSLTSQIRRSALSVPANIAEGCGRSSNAELARFAYIALGSASELDYHLLFAKDIRYLNEETYIRLSNELTIIRKMLNKFIQTLK